MYDIEKERQELSNNNFNLIEVVCNTNCYIGKLWFSSYDAVYNQLQCLKHYINTNEDINEDPIGDWDTLKTWNKDNLIELVKMETENLHQAYINKQRYFNYEDDVDMSGVLDDYDDDEINMSGV